MSKIIGHITFVIVWQSEQTDCRKCSACSEMIFSEMNRLFVVPKGSKKPFSDKFKTEFVICSSCQSIINDTL